MRDKDKREAVNRFYARQEARTIGRLIDKNIRLIEENGTWNMIILMGSEDEKEKIEEVKSYFERIGKVECIPEGSRPLQECRQSASAAADARIIFHTGHVYTNVMPSKSMIQQLIISGVIAADPDLANVLDLQLPKQRGFFKI